MFAESSPARRDIDEQEMASMGGKDGTEKPENNIAKHSPRSPAPSAPNIEVLEVGTSDTEEEADQLQLTHSTIRTEIGVDTHTETQDMGRTDANVADEDNHLPRRSSPLRRPSCPPAASVTQHPSSNDHDAGTSTHHSPQSPDGEGSRSSMHSLFSDSLEGERKASSPPPVPVDRTEDKVQERTSSVHLPTHDPEAWKEPSFITKIKGKGNARTVDKPDAPTPEVSKRRRRSAQLESPVSKRAKIVASEVHREISRQTTIQVKQPQDIEASAGEKMHPIDQPSTSPMNDTETTALQSFKPRLASLVVDFDRIGLGKRVSMPMVDMENEIRSVLFRTGRIRTTGKMVEQDGSVYIMR